MNNLNCRGVTMTIAWLLAVALVSAQITFSRDWTGGKRSGPQLMDCSQFTRLCRHFVHELRESITTELASKRRDPDKALLYDDE